MNQSNSVEKTVVKCMIVGSVALTTLAATGCNEVTGLQLSETVSEFVQMPADQVAIAGKLAANHNETFLACA